MSVWSWDLPYWGVGTATTWLPHGSHMTSHGSYSDHCCVTASLSYCGSVGTYSAQTTPQVYKAEDFHLYSLASVSQVVLWLHLSYWLSPPTLLFTVSHLLLTILLLLLTVFDIFLTVTLFLLTVATVLLLLVLLRWCSLLLCSCSLLWSLCSLSLISCSSLLLSCSLPLLSCSLLLVLLRYLW